MNMNEEKMAKAGGDLSFVNQWVHELTHGERSTLRVFLESFQFEMDCKDPVRRGNVLKRICLVVSKLPLSYPWELPQVELLINFFLMNYDNFDTPNCFILTALKRLLMIDLHVASNYIELLVDTLFRAGEVQTCAQKERFLFYQILDILLNKYYKELSTNIYFVSCFILCISGERDPRCLILVFRLFCALCKHFNSGEFPKNLFNVHASDLFDVVACYYPVEFNQNSKRRAEITKEILVSGCESCLLVHEEFAPFVFELIIEKLTDSEYSADAKLEVCSFLAKTCTVFSCSQFVDHIDQLCAGIRSVLLNLPRVNDDYVPEPINAAVSSMLKVLENSDIEDKRQRIEFVCQEFIEKGRMFVLQTELGLTGQMLAFFEILLKCSESSHNIVFENVFSWLLSLCRGDTASSAANKSEIVNSSLRLLCHWIRLASDFKQNVLLQKYHISFIEILDKYDREIAQLTCYNLLEVCVNFRLCTNEFLEKCKIFLRKSSDFICSENKELRNNCLMFIHAFAVANWTIAKNLIVEKIDHNKEITHLTPLLWFIIHDIDSLNFALSYLRTLYPTTSACSDDFQEIFLEMFKKNKTGNIALQQALLKQSLTCFFVRLEFNMQSAKDLEVQSKLLQQIGLTINDRTHLEGLCLIREKLKNCSSLLPGLYLYIIQSPYSDELLELLQGLITVDSNLIWYKSLIMAALVNKSAHYLETLKYMEKMRESFGFLESFKCKARLCAALLLVNRPEGSTYFTELLHDLVQYFDSKDITTLTNALVDMLTFDNSYSDPIKCKYRSTFLWQQRIFYQLVPIYVQYFNDLGKEFQNKRVVLFPLLSPLFTLATSSAAIMNDKYVELLPILCAALDTSGLGLCSEGQIISGLAALLKNATPEQLGDDFLLKLLPRLQRSLENSKDMTIHLAALECLKLIAQRWSSTTLLPFYSPIICSLIKISGSQKRIIRTKVANVRNLWELLPTM